EEMRKPQRIFQDERPDALVTYAFEVPKLYPQHEFYTKMGFKRVNNENPFFLYYPLKKGFEYKPKVEERNFTPLPEDEGKAVIFLDPNCPFCVVFAKGFEKAIKRVKEDIPVKFVNVFKEKKEVEKRGGIVPFCSVNGKAIHSFFKEKEKFLNEVRLAFEKIN
ncbi:MAG: hypothetical protein ACTSPI_16790, partial [Candidatus Heimdallarchaeaceae archaeon]